MIKIFQKRRPILLITTLLALFIFNASLSFANQYQVYRVVDGDTFTVKHGSIKITVRLVGIDAPEKSNDKRKNGQSFSRQSTQHLDGLVLNKVVDVKFYGPDRYGRTLGEVFVDGKKINFEMVKAGLTEVYRGTPAKGQNMEPYWKAEEEAKASNRGM